ncbi:MAG: hypothetical protein DRH08_12095 [Deltaproteobacteria bacterium]|nr:MAG: hypothetical protein DRH08_12095 [Deltaproteobacteria bacterium]
MIPAPYDWIVKQGDTIVTRFQVRNNITKVPEDITGYTFKMQVRKNAESDVVILEASTINGKIVNDGDPTLGKIAIQFDAADTAAVDPARYVYDVQYMDSNQNPAPHVTPVVGNFIVTAEVTR